MNMEINPTIEELRELIKACNDLAGHHILWVAKNGDVQVSPVPKDKTPEEFQKAHPDMKLRCETFEAGNEYVGPDAASDESWTKQLFDALTREWPASKSKPHVVSIGFDSWVDDHSFQEELRCQSSSPLT